MLFRRKSENKVILPSAYDEVDEIVKAQREFHQQQERHARTQTVAPKDEMSFLLRQRRGRRVDFEKHPTRHNPQYTPRNDPHFVATIKGFLQVHTDGSYRTTPNPRWATTFKTFEEADAAARDACQKLFDVRGQFYAVFVKP